MALSRRTGTRFQGSIWPGFVDAMTGLLLVLMFVLTIFMVVQFVLTERITGQETELNVLSGEVAALARALGLEETENAQLEARMGALAASLQNAQDQTSQQEALVASLTIERDRQAAELESAAGQITQFEAQVAGLLAARAQDGAAIAGLEEREAELLSAQEVLNSALATARSEIDVAAEAARLAASRREALDALVADLRAQNAEDQTEIADLRGQVEAGAAALSTEEAARLAEAAAAQALRDRLAGADTELTAMTLALEAQRREAEETLTLLAAARAAQGDLDAQLNEALIRLLSAEESAKTGATARTDLATAQDSLALAEQELVNLRTQVAGLQAEAEVAAQTGSEAQNDLSVAQQEMAGLRAKVAQLQAAEQVAAQAEIQTLATLTTAQQELARLQAQVVAQEAEAGDLMADRDALRTRLVAAVAARLAAETDVQDQQSAAQAQAALLLAARASLSEEEKVSVEAQRQTELLNQQVAALRTQLGNLQSLLDDAKAQDLAKEVELQSLGSELNTALARVAVEERRRAELEAAERARLEEEAKALKAQTVSLQDQTKDLEQYRSEFFGRLRDVLGSQEGVRIEGDRFVFSSEVLFPPGGAVLSREGRGEITKVANILRSVAGDIPSEIDWVIRVDGHTDNVPLSGSGRFADNWELSQGRALSVVKYMINFLGIPPDRLAANGFGQFQPLTLGDSEDARAQNRRIELKFTEK